MSAYFTYFPEVQNDLENSGQIKSVTNILKRFKVKSSVYDNLSLFHEYDIQEGDRPDTIAHKYYDSSAHAWIVLHFNNIVDPIFDWPLFGNDFEEYIKSKYGSIASAQSTVHEYRRVLTQQQTKVDGTIIPERTVVIDEDTYNTLTEIDKQSISKWDYEVELNDKKSKIKILDRKYLSKVISEVEDVLRYGV